MADDRKPGLGPTGFSNVSLKTRFEAIQFWHECCFLQLEVTLCGNASVSALRIQLQRPPVTLAEMAHLRL